MRASIAKDGHLSIIAESDLEAYALQGWWDRHLATQGASASWGIDVESYRKEEEVTFGGTGLCRHGIAAGARGRCPECRTTEPCRYWLGEGPCPKCGVDPAQRSAPSGGIRTW